MVRQMIMGKLLRAMGYKRHRDNDDRQVNRTKLIRAYLDDGCISEGYPVELIIEATNYCNLKCVMCPRDRMNRKIGMMDFQVFKKIIEESSGFVDFVYLHLFGEPLFHADIFKMIAYAGKAGIKTGLSTNATVLTERNTQQLLSSGLDLLILSLDNPSKDVYDKVRIGGNFEEVDKNVAYFLNQLDTSKAKIEVVLQMIDLDRTRNYQLNFKSRFQRQPNVHLKIKDFCNWAGQIEEISQLVDSNVTINNTKCFEPWRALTIYWDGTVVPCCNDFDGINVLGNVRHSSIKTIWNGKAMQEFRKSHVTDKPSIKLCRLCSVAGLTYEDCLKKTSPFRPWEREIEYYSK